MTLSEAKKVAAIVSEADGGCSACVGALVEDLNRSFPEFEWSMPPDDGENRVFVRERTT